MQRSAILSPVASLAPPNYSTLCHKRQEFLNKDTKYKMCILIFSTTLFETFLIPRKIQRDTAINVNSFLCKVPVILVDFSQN